MRKMNDVRKVLDYLDKNGWYQGDMFCPDNESACIKGAMVGSNVFGVLDIIRDVVEEQFADRINWQPHVDPIVQFNDHPDTTYADVVMVLEKAAVLEMENG
jgi:hypothetical protein